MLLTCVRGAVVELDLGRVGAVPPQEHDRLRGDLDGARRLVLHRPEHGRRVTPLDELALDLHAPAGQVEVAPPEPGQLALAHPGVQRERVERGRLRPGGLRGGEERLRLVRLPAVLAGVGAVLRRVRFAHDELGDVALHEPFEHRGLERAMNERVVLRERRGRQCGERRVALSRLIRCASV